MTQVAYSTENDLTEKTFVCIGTARGTNGVVKVRWTNDLYGHYKRILHAGGTEIEFHEMPEPMTKLNALNWLLKNKELTEEQQEAVFIKKLEKTRQDRLAQKKIEKLKQQVA